MTPLTFSKAVSARLTGSRLPFAAALVMALAAALIAPLWQGSTPNASAAPLASGVFPETKPANVTVDGDTAAVELGMRFRPAKDGTVSGAQLYKGSSNARVTPTSATLWSSAGKVLARTSIKQTTDTGWIEAKFSSAVKVTAGSTYTISYFAPRGRYAATNGGLASPVTRNGVTALGGNNGVYKYAGSSSFPTSSFKSTNYWVDVLYSAGTEKAPTPTPTPTPKPTPTPTPTPKPTPTNPASTGFPTEATTGVPAGVTLSDSGSMTVTAANTVINAKHIRGELLVKAPGVVVKNTRVTGTVRLYDQGASLEMIDSEILDPGREFRAITNHDITLHRVEIRGFVQSMECNSNCKVYDSLLHKQTIPSGSADHGDGILIDGAANMVFKGNTLACDAQANSSGGGCSAALALYNGPNYSRTMRNTLVEGNLFKAGPAGYCVYGGGPKSDNVDFINNVWERGTSGKCGVFGPITAKATDASSAWTGNRYTDGTAIN